MSLGRRSRLREPINFWPSFVDALSTLLIVVLFFLMVFVLAHFFLGKDLDSKNTAIVSLNEELLAISNSLLSEKNLNHNLSLALTAEQGLSKSLSAALDSEKALTQSLTVSLNDLQDDVKEKAARMALLAQDIKVLQTHKEKLEKEAAAASEELDGERKISDSAKAHVAFLNSQVETMTHELKKLSAALDASEKVSEEQKAQIVDLGRQLNRALAQKVSELASYRSEFFGQLRKILKDREDIRIEGDRFVFQSELFFQTGSAELEAGGKKQLNVLAKTLLSISKEIPPGLNWILRVDGHTDAVPIKNERFASNWELSAARAISVVEYLISRGVPKNRIAAAGFGEFQPISAEKNEKAFKRNRRIEFKLTER